MKHWCSSIKIESSDRELKKVDLVDIYKKEILDTRITVSELLKKTKLINFAKLKKGKSNLKVCANI